MKSIKILTLALFVASASLFSNAQSKKLNVAKSNINWVGKKVTGQHEGTISFKEGTLVFKGKNLEARKLFTVDMTSINTTDLEAGKGKEKLDGHLKADDFFGVEKFPTAKLDFKLISNNGDGTYNVVGNLTIKDITKSVNFVLTVKGNTASTTLKVDRTKYDIKYGSGSFFDNLGDKAINDEFDLNVNLVF